jgi:hypothetical protein
MNASTTFDKASAIAAKVAKPRQDDELHTEANTLAASFPSERKADVCRLLAEAMKDKERGTRNGVSVSTTLTKALESAKGFTTLELASLKAFWTLAVVADSIVNAKGNGANK